VLCNKHGLIDMSDAKGRPVAVQCSHNLSAMKAHAEKRGYRFDQKLHTQEA
jgi:hypothetical protein